VNALLALTAVVGLLLTAGCSSGSSSTIAPRAAADDVAGLLHVRADRSLREVFDQVAQQVHRAHPKLSVRLEYSADPAASAAQADIVASADEAGLAGLSGTGSFAPPQEFATEVLTLVVPTGNPGAVGVLTDLRRRGVTVALCRQEQPCGQAAATLLERANVSPNAVVRADDVDGVLAAVAARRAQAGLVWTNDIHGTSGRGGPARRVQQVRLAATSPDNIRLTGLSGQPLLITSRHGSNPAAVAAFEDQLRSGAGQQVLREDGYR
jgi:molybdate transport system substrate-binding protein